MTSTPPPPPPPSNNRRRAVIAAIVAVVAVAAVALYWFFDPSTNFFPRCQFYQLTGWQCPGCGAQRAFHALLGGDIAAAWHFNALLFFIVPLLAVMLLSEILRNRYPRFNRVMTSMAMVVVLLAVMVVWTVWRNLVQ